MAFFQSKLLFVWIQAFLMVSYHQPWLNDINLGRDLLSWADLMLQSPELSTFPNYLLVRKEKQTWGEELERVRTGCVMRRAASLRACLLSELLHCSLGKETGFAFVTSKPAPPVLRGGGLSMGSIWGYKGGAGEPWRPLPFINLPIKQRSCRFT